MTVSTLEGLLQPISEAKPAGEDQSGEAEWQAIKEARRSDDKFNRGSWDRPLKEADWHAVKELSSELLSRKTKDLRLAVFLTEANLNLNTGFAGLADSLRLICSLLSDFWSTGLFPLLEDGDVQYRAQALDWLGEPEKMPSAIRGIPLTKRSDGGQDYSWSNFEDARTVGWEKDLRTPTGDVDEAKARKREAYLAAGHISREMFEMALASTSRSAIDALAKDFDAAWVEFLALDKVIDDKFGAQGPGLQAAREAFEDCRNLILDCQNKKREQEPDSIQSSGASPATQTERSDWAAGGFFSDEMSGAPGSNGSWHAAENLVRAGNVKEGLAEMTRLAASEHGRIRFHRKLRLAETCFAIKRDRLAVAILEELAKEIDEHHLESWESAELLGRVWGRLYRSYKSSDGAQPRASELFDRLCRLDPWQALRWDD
jgi:type VI secretion system protein ImpA